MLLVKETDVQFDGSACWPFRQAKCHWSGARLKQRPSRWQGQPDRTHKHIPLAEAEWLRQPVVLPPALAHSIIKPRPPNSLLVTMTHFPSIPRAALGENIYHKMLKGAQIGLFRSSPLSSKFSCQHLLFSHKSLPAVLLNTHLPTLQGDAAKKVRGSVQKRFDVPSFSLNSTLCCLKTDVHVTIMGLDIDHLLATAWRIPTLELTMIHSITQTPAFPFTHFNSCFPTTKISTQPVAHNGYLLHLFSIWYII